MSTERDRVVEEAAVVNGWTENKKWVLTELERLNLKAETIDQKLNDMKAIDLPRVQNEIRNNMEKSSEHIYNMIDEIHTRHLAAIKEDVIVLKLKSGIWGGLAGVIAALASLLISGKLF